MYSCLVLLAIAVAPRRARRTDAASVSLQDNSKACAVGKKKPGAAGLPEDPRLVLLDDLNDAAGLRINQHRAVVHNRIAILRLSILCRHVVVSNALGRQLGTDHNGLSIRVG